MSTNNQTEGVKLGADSYKAIKFYNETKTPKIIQIVMKWSRGAIKKGKQAEYILLGFVIVAMAISFYLFFGRNSIAKPNLQQLEQMKPAMIKK